MKVKDMIEMLEDMPQDYDMCFSEYTAFVPEEGEGVKVVKKIDKYLDEDDEIYFVVLDCPIVGVLLNNETKEARFFTEKSNKEVIREIEGGKNWRRLDKEE